MISEIETTDIKASYSVSRVLWTLMDAVFSSDDEEDALSFHDKELLEDVLRYGTIAEVSRRKGINYATLFAQVNKTLERLKRKIYQFELEMIQTKFENRKTQMLLEKQNLELIDKESKLYQTEDLLAQAQAEIASLRHEIENAPKETGDTTKKSYNPTLQDEPYMSQYMSAMELLDQKNRQIKKLQATIDRMERAQKKKKDECSVREQKLKARISSLENLIEWYKTQKAIC